MTVQQRVSQPRGRSAGQPFSARMRTSAQDRRRLNAGSAAQTQHGRPARREGLTFESKGVRCTAWQWWPDGTDAPPCVVLAYGYSGPGEQPPNAESIADARQVMLPEAVIDAIGSAMGQARRRDAGRFLTTVLVTDIVDSTATATRLGDTRWREVLADHYSACRAQVERNGGELVNTTGDGVVAIFDGPARAVRAAIAIEASARALGIAVRAGLHTGECERLGDGLAGVAVHIAARVCALAGADDVLTTGTVRDLVIGSMLAFEPRGHHDLKGVPGSWPVFSATDPQ
jgi:class 3 adenylate cyclase